MSRHARIDNPHVASNSDTLSFPVHAIVNQAKASRLTLYYITLAKQVLVMACDEGLIKQSDLTEHGEMVLESFRRKVTTHQDHGVGDKCR